MTALNRLGLRRELRDEYKLYMEQSGSLRGFSDLIGMVAPFMPLHGSRIIRVFCPYGHCEDSPLRDGEGIVTFHRLLRKKEASSDLSEQMKNVLDRCKDVCLTYEQSRYFHPRNLVKNGKGLDKINCVRSI